MLSIIISFFGSLTIDRMYLFLSYVDFVVDMCFFSLMNSKKLKYLEDPDRCVRRKKIF